MNFFSYINTLPITRSLAYKKLFFAQIKINLLLFCVINNSYFSFLFSIYNEFVRSNKAIKIKHYLVNFYQTI